MKKKEKEEKAGKTSFKETIKKIRSKFGDDSIMRMDERPKADVETISTGSIGLNFAIGIGGYPCGKVIEMFGPESSGKTTMSLHAIAEAQKLGMQCVFIDAEHSMDPKYARNLGVKTDELMISQPNNGEEAMQIVDALVRGGETGLIVVDSVAALTPRSVIEGEIGDVKIGALARLMSQSLNVLKGSIKKSNTTVIFINQLRANIAAMATWGAPAETTAGGKALKFYSDLRLEVKRVMTIKKGDLAVGSRTRIKVVKNKVAAPFGVAEVDIMFNVGILKEGELLMLGDTNGIVDKTTAGYAWGDTKLGRGYESAVEFLKENSTVYDSIRSEIITKLKSTL